MANTISGITKLNGTPTQARVTLINTETKTVAASQLSEGMDGVTKSLLHFDGASGSQTFTDECGKTWTHTGASVQLASIAKFGATSLYVGNTASWIQTAATADHDFGDGDFTVEAFLYLNAPPPAAGLYRVAISRDDTAVSGNRGWLLLLDGDNAGKLAFACSVGAASYSVMSSVAPATGVWIHVAVARSGGTLRMYLDGVQQPSVAIAGVLNSPALDTRVGDGKAGASNLGSWNGYIDELRITKGSARYTANFTPPTSPFTLGAASGAFSFTGLAAGRYELLTLIDGYKALVDGPWVLDGVAAPITDDFNTDTLAQYTQYADVAAVWSVVAGQMTAGGGGASQSVLTRNGVSFTNGSVSCNMNYASDAGLVLRFQDNSNYYLATITDGGSVVAPQNNVRIYKRIGGAFTQLGGNAAIAFPRNTNHDFKFTASGTSLEVHFDGVSILSVTDSSISAAGKAGMRHSGAGDPNGSKFNSFSWPSA